MFEARNAAASRLLVMVRHDVARSRMLARAIHNEDPEQVEEASGLGKIALIGGASLAAAILAALDHTQKAPDGVEDTSIFEKGKDWVKDIFKSKKEKEEEAHGTQVGPSPLTKPEDVRANRVKTAKADKNTMDMLRSVAATQDSDYALLYSVAGAESSFRANADVGTSSAVGMFQFTEPTWKWLIGKYGLDYSMDDRKDARKSAHVASMYLTDITKVIHRAMGRKPSYGEIYMGYFLGPQGAVNFLKALKKNPNAIGAELFPKAAKANPWVFYTKKGDPLTLEQIMAKQEGKITSYAQDADPSYNSSVARSDVQAPPVSNPQSTAPSRPMQSVQGIVPVAAKSGDMPIISVQFVRDVSSGYKDSAPAVKEQASAPSVASSPSILPVESSAPPANATIVRGRDNRLYILNH